MSRLRITRNKAHPTQFMQESADIVTGASRESFSRAYRQSVRHQNEARELKYSTCRKHHCSGHLHARNCCLCVRSQEKMFASYLSPDERYGDNGGPSSDESVTDCAAIFSTLRVSDRLLSTQECSNVSSPLE